MKHVSISALRVRVRYHLQKIGAIAMGDRKGGVVFIHGNTAQSYTSLESLAREKGILHPWEQVISTKVAA